MSECVFTYGSFLLLFLSLSTPEFAFNLRLLVELTDLIDLTINIYNKGNIEVSKGYLYCYYELVVMVDSKAVCDKERKFL